MSSFKQFTATQPIIFNTVDYQRGANTVYQYWATQGTSTTVPRQFKSQTERMQYILGRQNQASCGVGKTTQGVHLF